MNRIGELPQGDVRNRWDWPDLTASLGCATCRFKGDCGGICADGGFFDCTGDCCRSPQSCTRACLRNPRGLVDALREVGGNFDFNKLVPRSRTLNAEPIPLDIPLVEHRGSVAWPRALDFCAIKLATLFRRDGTARFDNADALRDHLRLERDTRLVVSGIDQDDDVEAWWSLGLSRRQYLLSQFRALDLALLTVPNFSLALNEPRPTQMHAMSRIAIAHREIVSAGIPAALHIGAATEHDYARWASYLDRRDEITHIATDFTTGPARQERREVHLTHLRAIGRYIRRPLTLVIKGRCDAIPQLASAFHAVIYIDTTAFSKTVHRRRLVIDADGNQRDVAAPTPPNEPLDDLWEENWATRQVFLTRLRGSYAA